jgi:hypothetical protein
MLFEEMDTEESGNSQSDVSSLDNDFSRVRFESSSAEEQVMDDDGDDDAHLHVWGEIESESDAEFSEEYGMMEELSAKSEVSTNNPVDCYWHFITNEIISLKVRETKRYTEQHLQTQKLSQRSKTLQWQPTTNEEMLKLLGIIIEVRKLIAKWYLSYWNTEKESRWIKLWSASQKTQTRGGLWVPE